MDFLAVSTAHPSTLGGLPPADNRGKILISFPDGTADDTAVDLSRLGMFLPSDFTDDDLTYLRTCAISELTTRAPRFGKFVHSWADHEEFSRVRKDGKKDTRRDAAFHMLAMPPLDEYSDAELADTLEAITIWTFYPDKRSEVSGRWIDRISMAVTMAAAERLRNQSKE